MADFEAKFMAGFVAEFMAEFMGGLKNRTHRIDTGFPTSRWYTARFLCSKRYGPAGISRAGDFQTGSV